MVQAGQGLGGGRLGRMGWLVCLCCLVAWPAVCLVVSCLLGGLNYRRFWQYFLPKLSRSSEFNFHTIMDG